MLKTTPLVLAALLAGRLTPALAQNTSDENNLNADTPYVQHIRPDRPGQTITPGVLRPGEFQVETGLRSYSPNNGSAINSNVNTLRVGFFNSMELRVTQPYVFGAPGTTTVRNGEQVTTISNPVGLAPLTVGAKLMLTPDRASRFQATMLVETAMPNTGSPGLRRSTWAPSGRLLLSQQLGRRAALEGNFGFTQQGLTMDDALGGQYLGTLALTAPIGDKTGYFVEGYMQGRHETTAGATAGLYYRPLTGLRLDAAVGKIASGINAGATTLNVGLSFRIGGNKH